MDDEIRLLIPATPEYVRLARLTAASLASRLGFTFDEVEDLRIAVDELCHCLLGSRGVDGAVNVTCSVREEGVAVRGVLQADNGGPSTIGGPGLTELTRRILDAVVDEWECRSDAPNPTFSLFKKRVATPAP